MNDAFGVGLSGLIWMSIPSCIFTSQPSALDFTLYRANRAAAATSEQFGEIVHWVETHSLEGSIPAPRLLLLWNDYFIDS